MFFDTSGIKEHIIPVILSSINTFLFESHFEFPTAFTSLYFSFVSITFLCKYFYLSVLL